MARPSLRNLVCLVGGSSLVMTGCASLSMPNPSSSAHPPSTAVTAARTKSPSTRSSQLTMFQSPDSSDSVETIEGNGDGAASKPTKPSPKTRNPLRLAVLRLGVTEPRGTSLYNYGNKYKDGVFACGYCGAELFDGVAKYESGSGWPSFWRSVADGAVSYKRELDGRLECQCGKCKSHLGHVFLDGPPPDSVDSELLQSSPASDPRGTSNKYLPRFCINGAAMDFQQR